MEELDFFSRLRSGDPALLRALYEEHLDPVIGWIVTNSGTMEDAHDIFHDTIEALIFKSYSSSQLSHKNIGGYIMQVAKNKWIDQLRRKKSFKKVINQISDRYDHEYSVEHEYINIEEEHIKQKALMDAFKMLSAKCQKLLTLIIQEHSTQEIVKALDMTNANTMYRRKHACLEYWKKNMNSIGYNYES